MHGPCTLHAERWTRTQQPRAQSALPGWVPCLLRTQVRVNCQPLVVRLIGLLLVSVELLLVPECQVTCAARLHIAPPCARSKAALPPAAHPPAQLGVPHPNQTHACTHTPKPPLPSLLTWRARRYSPCRAATIMSVVSSALSGAKPSLCKQHGWEGREDVRVGAGHAAAAHGCACCVVPAPVCRGCGVQRRTTLAESHGPVGSGAV